MGDDGVEIGMTGSEGTRPAKGWKGAARDSGMHPLWAPSSGLGREGGTGEASHGERVGHAALALARALGLRERDAVLIGDAARFHDVGKLALSGKILRKPGRLPSAEFEAVKTHPLHGWTLLRQRHGARFELAAQIALHHHENWDGTGYPLGLAGENIPLPARIVSVVDVFDALVHARCYKDAWPASRALTLIASAGGRKFDPRVVRAFLSLRLPLLQASAATPAWSVSDPPDGGSSSRPRLGRREPRPFPAEVRGPALVAARTQVSSSRTPGISCKCI